MTAPTLERAMRHPRSDHRATATNNQRPHRHPTCGRKGKEREVEKLPATALNRTIVQAFSVMRVLRPMICAGSPKPFYRSHMETF